MHDLSHQHGVRESAYNAHTGCIPHKNIIELSKIILLVRSFRLDECEFL